MMADALKRSRGAAAQHASTMGRLRRTVSGGLTAQPGTEHMPRSSSHGSLASAAGSTAVKVTFVVPKHVPFGQSLALVGHGRELGSWEPTHAVSLRWSEGDVWTTELDLPPGEHQFKCVAVSPEGELEWQPGSNRVIQVPADVDAALEAHCDWFGSKTMLVPCTSNNSGNSNASAMSEECMAYMDDMSEDPFSATLSGMLSPSDSITSAEQPSVTASMAAMAMDLEQEAPGASPAELDDEPSVGPPQLQQLQQKLAAGSTFAPGTLSVGGRHSLEEGRGMCDMASPTSDASTDDMLDVFVSVSTTSTAPSSPASAGPTAAASTVAEPPSDLLDLAHSVLAGGPQTQAAAAVPTTAAAPRAALQSKFSSPFATNAARTVARAATVVAAPQAAPPRPATKEAVRTRRLVSGASMIPHVDKVATGGEDAYFISTAGGGGGAIGVSDGVSAWADDGIDPGDYSRTLMTYCCEAMEASTPLPGMRASSKPVDPRAVLKYAQQCTLKHGSATAVLAVLQPGGKLVVANLGDCGVKVVRGRQIALSTQPQQHEFNLPYQLSHPRLYPETDDADSADRYSFNVQAGDIIIAGSDGLFDNLWDDELLELIDEAGFGASHRGDGSGCDADGVAKCAAALAAHAHKNAADKDYRSPWSVAAGKEAGLLARLFAKGGKMDDVTCVVSVVQ